MMKRNNMRGLRKKTTGKRRICFETLEDRLVLSLTTAGLDVPFASAALSFEEQETAVFEKPSSSESIKEYYVGTCYDVNKYWAGDSYLCWAAGASNLLAYTGWGGAATLSNGNSSSLLFKTVNDIYNYYFGHFTDGGSWSESGITWFINGTYDVGDADSDDSDDSGDEDDEQSDAGSGAILLDAGDESGEGEKGVEDDTARPIDDSGKFFPCISDSDLKGICFSIGASSYKGSLISKMADFLRAGDGVTMSIIENKPKAAMGHVVTVWGYCYDTSLSSDDPSYYTGLIITDSDDNKEGTVTVSIQWNEADSVYYTTDYDDVSYKITDFTILKKTAALNGVSVTSYTGSYDGAAHSLTVNGIENPRPGDEYTVFYTYNGETSDTAPSFTEAGIYDVAVVVILNKYEAVWSTKTQVSILTESKEVPSVIVTTLDDVVDYYDGKISLREAIEYAESGDTITFDSSLAGGRILLSGTTLTISKSLTIKADSIGGITIDANEKSNVIEAKYLDNAGTLQLENITVTGGLTNGRYGGGIYAYACNLILIGCTIKGNYCQVYHGGGICAFNCNLTLTNCAVTENHCGGNGGGIYVEISDSVILTNCLISENYCDVRSNNESGDYECGGGIYMKNRTKDTKSEVTLTNCTVVYNSAKYGGAVYIEQNPAPTLTFKNSILLFNPDRDSEAEIYNHESSAVLNAYNTLTSFTGWHDSSNIYTYNSDDPLFTDSDNSNYTLAKNSQAIDKGNNDYNSTDCDLAGKSRIIGDVIDLGAYEYDPRTLAVETPVILTGSEAAPYVSYGGNRHQLLWTPVKGAVSYTVSFCEDGSEWYTVETTMTRTVITELTYGANVQYSVRANGGVSYADSDWSSIKSFRVCPMDINNDGVIATADRLILASCWLSSEGDKNYIYAADIDGDGDIACPDRNFLVSNWLREADDENLCYPKPMEVTKMAIAEFVSEFDESVSFF